MQTTPEPSTTPNVLIIDDDEGVRGFCSHVVTLRRLDARVACTGAEGLQAMGRARPDCVLLDLDLPDCSGMDLLKDIRERFPASRVVMITGHNSVELAVEAIKLGASDYLTKPLELARLTRILDEAAAPTPEPTATNTRSFCDIVGVSDAMQRIFSLIQKAARSDSTVLIEGESGTGKELVARAIHRLSARGQKPFVPVDCGAIPTSLIESELFGHMAGAYTDARTSNVGLLRSAGSGSVFLDEIGELPAAVQVKLLRALQEMEVRPVGSNRAEPLDARMIAATNRDLGKEVALGRFRHDLFYRLHVIPVFVPALRERREDVPLLVEQFMRVCGRRSGREMSVSPGAMESLMRHDWPGNVRELENVIERAFALLDSDRMEAAHVEQLFHRNNGASKPAATPRAEPASGRPPAENQVTPLAQHEAAAILRALEASGWNKRAAARSLGIGIATLYRKIRKYHITTC